MPKKTEIILRKVKEFCQPLLEYRPYIKTIYIFGSITRGDYKKGSDIDTIVVFDDTKEGSEEASVKIDGEIQKIQGKANKMKVNLSFQRLMPLSTWWDLIRDGEPWVVSSMENPHIIYDHTGYVKLISTLVRKGHVYNRAEKAEKLIDRTYSYEVKNRELLLNSASEIFLACLEAAEIFLLSRGRTIFEPRKMVIELKKLGVSRLDGFEDMVDIMEKINKGVLSEFSGKNIDHYQDKARSFVSEIESIILGK